MLRAAFFIGILAVLSTSPASAMGTAQVRQKDGAEKTYKSVTVKLNDSNLALTSKDGAGTLVVGKSACARVGAVLRCLPYDAVLSQYGSVYHIPVTTGTLWVNPTQNTQTVPSSSKRLAPHGVLLSMRTKAGTSVSLTGTIDEMHK